MIEDKYSKEDFFLTGSAESCPLFYYACSIGADRAAQALFIIINKKGSSTWYIEKHASETLMRNWLALSTPEVAARFTVWKDKWSKVESRLLEISRRPSQNWQKDWEEIDTMGLEFWEESYFVETIDPFAEDLERSISSSMEKSGLDTSHLFELISTTEPTRTQRAVNDFNKLERREISPEDYIKKYWYFRGSWVGGEVLSTDMLSADFLPKPVDIDYVSRQTLQQELEESLDEDTKRLISLLRILTLWREERKAYMQMMSVAYTSIAKKASSIEGVDYKDLQWIRPEEIDRLKTDPTFARDRRENSVFLLSPKYNPPILLTGKDTEPIINEFFPKNRIEQVKGTVAFKGIITGRVRLVLKEHQFGKFQKGEILVTTSTRPEFVPIMGLASAIVTDEGGLTSHAAIIARELKKPCVTGTKVATHTFIDGDLIEVDANTGIVRLLK